MRAAALTSPAIALALAAACGGEPAVPMVTAAELCASPEAWESREVILLDVPDGRVMVHAQNDGAACVDTQCCNGATWYVGLSCADGTMIALAAFPTITPELEALACLRTGGDDVADIPACTPTDCAGFLAPVIAIHGRLLPGPLVLPYGRTARTFGVTSFEYATR